MLKVILIIAFFAVSLVTVTGLTCMRCQTREHKGCTNLDYAVLQQECVGDEVCAKFSTWHMKLGPNGMMIPYGMPINRHINVCHLNFLIIHCFEEVFFALHIPGKGTIRNCVKPGPDGLNLNSCLQVGNDMQPREHCFCNNTNFCNGTPVGRHQFNSIISHNWKLILISLLIYHCAQFFLASP